MNSCGLVLLAAGASTRLGQPKQLLPWQEKSLLQLMTETALQSVNGLVVVVLGANAGDLQPVVDAKKVNIVYNAGWQEGIASSIRSGLTALLQVAPLTENVIFMVCDQPYVTPSLIKELINVKKQTGKKIVASKYADTTGIPVIFDKSIFPSLLKLEGNTGAKKIIQQFNGEVETIDFPLGHIDIDTKEDYDNFTKRAKAEQ